MKDDDQLPPTKLRMASDVAIRCVILHGVVAAGHQRPRPEIVRWLKQHDLWTAVSPKESLFLLSESPSQQQFVDATWRAEALHTLLWSIHRLAAFAPPNLMCDLHQPVAALPKLYSDPTEFVTTARLRDARAIAEILGPIYEIHWEVRDAQLNGRPLPNGYESGAVFERHYAYNWLTCYQDYEWDDVSTDT